MGLPVRVIETSWSPLLCRLKTFWQRARSVAERKPLLACAVQHLCMVGCWTIVVDQKDVRSTWATIVVDGVHRTNVTLVCIGLCCDFMIDFHNNPRPIKVPQLLLQYVDVDIFCVTSSVYSKDTTMDPEVVANFLGSLREEIPEDLQQSFLEIEDFWDRKLWHQLTEVLLNYFQNPQSAPQRLPLFSKFILSFADKINQLKFVSLGLSAATQCSGTYARD